VVEMRGITESNERWREEEEKQEVRDTDTEED
jgi:hypothetical protein